MKTIVRNGKNYLALFRLNERTSQPIALDVPIYFKAKVV